MNISILKDFFDYMETQKFPIDATFVFVYNDYNTYVDDPHIEECFNEEEVREILDSVSDLFQNSLCFGSEKKFIDWCNSLDFPKNHIYVYSMAQSLEGYGRRTLIPAICEYYGFININADAYASAIGCNKETMYKLLSIEGFNNLLPPTIFLDNTSTISYERLCEQFGKNIILKPICESCCIDVIVLQNYEKETLYKLMQDLLLKYKRIMIQKYIPGKEIGVTVSYHKNHAYAMVPMEIIFAQNKSHLTHADSFYGNYQLQECALPSYVTEACEMMSEVLRFYCTSRYDFRYDGSNYYLFDISPNPTINGYTSSNFAAQATLNCDHRGILRFMVYEKFKLFEPTFSGTH